MENILDYENSLNEYNWEFFRITNNLLEVIFKDLQEFKFVYYVKGGKAVDAYLSEKIGSPDWDIIVEPKSFELCIEYITTRVQTSLGEKVKIDTQDVVFKNLKGIKIGIDYNDLFWTVDIFPQIVDPLKLSVIGGIPYLGLSFLIKNLKQNSFNRSKILEDQEKLVPRKEQELIENLKDTTELKDQTKKYLIEFISTKCNSVNINSIEKMIQYFEETVKKNAEVLSYENISEFKSDIENYEKLKKKTKRTNTRLLELVKICDNDNNIQLSKEYLLELCDFCTTNETARTMGNLFSVYSETYPNTNINCQDILKTDLCNQEASM